MTSLPDTKCVLGNLLHINYADSYYILPILSSRQDGTKVWLLGKDHIIVANFFVKHHGRWIDLYKATRGRLINKPKWMKKVLESNPALDTVKVDGCLNVLDFQGLLSERVLAWKRVSKDRDQKRRFPSNRLGKLVSINPSLPFPVSLRLFLPWGQWKKRSSVNRREWDTRNIEERQRQFLLIKQDIHVILEVAYNTWLQPLLRAFMMSHREMHKSRLQISSEILSH